MAQNQRRMVYLKIWSSVQFASLSDRAKILFIGMLTLADDDGRLIANASYLRGQIFSFNEEMEISDIKESRREIKDKNLIEVYEVDGVEYVQHPNWEKYQIIRADLYSPSTLPNRNGIVTKPLRSSNEAVTKTCYKVSKDKISKVKISKVKISKDNIISYTENDKRLTELLYEKVKINYSFLTDKRTDKKIISDYEIMNKINRIDKWTYEQIEYIINWSQEDEFWRKNIRSVLKLRKQFENLVVRAKEHNTNNKINITI